MTDDSGEARVRLTTNVKTTVTATAGGKTTASGAVVSVLGAPTVELTCQGSGSTAASNCSQVAGQPVTFTAKRGSSTTALIDTTLDFGDSFTLGLGTLSSTTTVTHTYNFAGSYTATLRVRDVNNATTGASTAVSVTARPVIGVNLTATVATATKTGQRVEDRKSTRLNSSHSRASRMPSSA